MRYQLDQFPNGLSIDATTGLISWTPTEAQGPGRYDVVVHVFNQTRPQSFTTQRFAINVSEVNTPPVITPIPDQMTNQLLQLSFTVSATDADLPVKPGNQFTFSLDNPLQGASIDATTGRFIWTPNVEPGTYTFTVRVRDNGSPALESTADFNVIVNPPLGM